MNQNRVPPKELIAAAKLNPNGWVFQIEGNFDPGEPIPSEAIVGAWSVDGEGEIVGDFIPNPNHVPKQRPQPTDED